MSGVPDYTLEDTLDFKFTTRQFSTGAPFAFASGAIEIYEDNSLTQITGAETLTLEFDGVTGLHNLRVVATAANGFANGGSYHCVVSVGTVDSVSVVGEVVQQFSIGRSAAAVDLANGTDGLSAIKAETALILEDTGTTIPGTITTLQADTDDIQTRLPAALVGGAMDSDVSVLQANVITAASINAAALTAAKFGAGAIDANALATDAVNEIRDALLPTQNVAFDDIKFLFVAASDGRTPITGATGTGVTRSIDGGAFGAGTGTLAEIGNGIYQYDASMADMNGGKIMFRFTGTGGTPGAPDDTFVNIVTTGGV